MHAGKISGQTAAGRVYRLLRSRRGRWVSGWDLTIGARVTAVGTRVSEVRRQLPAGEAVEGETYTRDDGGRGYRYRLTVARRDR